MLGRGFDRDGDPVLSGESVLSHGFWQRRFGGDPNAVGRSLIFMPTIAVAAGVELGGMMSAEAERHLARALARVIVHEAFHAIAPGLPHAQTGLTSADLTRDALLRGKAQIAAEWLCYSVAAIDGRYGSRVKKYSRVSHS